MAAWAGGCRRACSWSVRRGPARRSSPRPSPAKPRCRSSRSRAQSSWRCSSGSARPASAISFSRRESAPAIIFIDELDALGRARGIGPYGGHDEKEQTLNQLLVELDGFDSSSGLVIIGATNRPEILDPALLRAGRFDRQVLVDRPDKAGRVQILSVHMRKVKLAPDVNPEAIAALTPGFT